VAGVFELDCNSCKSSEAGGNDLPSNHDTSLPIATQSPDWPSCYALDENLHEPSHPLFEDVPAHPLHTAKNSMAGATAAAETVEACSLKTVKSVLGEHVNTQLFLSRGHTATQLHRDPFDNV